MIRARALDRGVQRRLVVREPSVALVPRAPDHLVVERTASHGVLPGIMATTLTSLALLLGGLPVISTVVVAIASVSGIALLAALPGNGTRRREVAAPETIASFEIRQTYRGILVALADIERAAAAAPGLATAAAPVIERSTQAVQQCGRLAMMANPLQHYLDGHDPAWMRAEVDRLSARTELANDARTSATFARATAARARQLTTYDELRTMRDRIHARLELVQAALDTFAAQLVKLQVLEDEQLALAGVSVTDELDGVTEELELLETALAA